MSEKLNPCPECGGDANIFEPVEGMFVACCTECGLSYKAFDDKETAVFNWNERTINAQLKPCPFCGNPANILHGSSFSHEYWHVACSKCLVRTREVNSPDDAIGLWNMRSENKNE